MTGGPAAYERDVVGVGALNLDYLVACTVPPGGFEQGSEHSVDEPVIGAVLEAAGPSHVAVAFGGSAFNAVHAIGYARTGLRLGFVGVAGRVPAGGLSVVDELDAFDIDRRYVLRDDARLGGVCVSLLHRGERTLLTHSGANDGFADHLDRHAGDLIGYLARTRVVHVSSLLDGRSPQRLLSVLRAVKQANPEVVVCLDPGHGWSTRPGPEVRGMVGLCDYLLVNDREFRALGTAGRRGPVVIVKQPGEVRVRGAGGVEIHRHEPLAGPDIVDSTGAGDVFAAGLVIGLARDGGQVGRGVRLGMRLARHKLRHLGKAGHPGFAELVEAWTVSRPR